MSLEKDAWGYHDYAARGDTASKAVDAAWKRVENAFHQVGEAYAKNRAGKAEMVELIDSVVAAKIGERQLEMVLRSVILDRNKAIKDLCEGFIATVKEPYEAFEKGAKWEAATWPMAAGLKTLLAACQIVLTKLSQTSISSLKEDEESRAKPWIKKAFSRMWED